MMCWPPYRSQYPSRLLKEFKGSRLIYIGEWSGCTANYKFHDNLDKWGKEVKHKAILPQWPTLHDELFLYKRR
jgi:hypothetical protein